MGYLLVDDQKAARMLLRVFLLRQGVGFIEESVDSVSALRLLLGAPVSATPFKAAFVSRTMPEMSGCDFVRAVRQKSGWAQFPIVVVSEDADPALRHEAFAAGATDYLLRPYTEQEIQSVLQRIKPPARRDS
jgi:two-component system chemotaxis response regulator CheY